MITCANIFGEGGCDKLCKPVGADSVHAREATALGAGKGRKNPGLVLAFDAELVDLIDGAEFFDEDVHVEGASGRDVVADSIVVGAGVAAM
jgi:hypothetical protein